MPIAAAGLLYMQVIGNRLIPIRDNDIENSAFDIRPYLAEVIVLPESPLIGKTLSESSLGRDLDLTVVRVIRNENRYLIPRPQLEFKAGDELLVKGERSRILDIGHGRARLQGRSKALGPRLQGEELQLAEIVLLPSSSLAGRTLKTLQFRQRFGLQVLGMNRRGKDVFSKLSQIRLRAGDELLVQGPRTNIATLNPDHFYTIGMVQRTRANYRRAPISIAIFVGVLVLASFKIVSLPIAVTLGTLAVFVTRCITPDEAYHEVAWQVLIVIGCMLALGTAMEYTGTAQFLATQVVSLLGVTQPIVLLTLFFAITMLLTQPMSNQAAAVLVLPIAVQTALRLGLNPRTFAVMIALSASCSFITPLEPACLIVYGPGHYKFLDFTKVGLLLTVIVYIVSILLVPIIWPPYSNEAIRMDLISLMPDVQAYLRGAPCQGSPVGTHPCPSSSHRWPKGSTISTT